MLKTDITVIIYIIVSDLISLTFCVNCMQVFACISCLIFLLKSYKFLYCALLLCCFRNILQYFLIYFAIPQCSSKSASCGRGRTFHRLFAAAVKVDEEETARESR